MMTNKISLPPLKHALEGISSILALCCEKGLSDTVVDSFRVAAVRGSMQIAANLNERFLECKINVLFNFNNYF